MMKKALLLLILAKFQCAMGNLSPSIDHERKQNTFNVSNNHADFINHELTYHLITCLKITLEEKVR